MGCNPTAQVLRTPGCKHLTNAGNWITSDAIRLNDMECWTFMARNQPAVVAGGVTPHSKN